MFQLWLIFHTCNHLPLLRWYKLLTSISHQQTIHLQFAGVVNNCVITCYDGVGWEKYIIARRHI